MQRIELSDTCCVCMDETSRDFLHKACCSVLVCRKCYNKLEVECFPERTKCPGCRGSFEKTGYSVEVVNNIAVPRAYCGQLLPDVKSLKEHDQHVLECAECLKKIVRGHTWFETQLTEKFTGMKRKMNVLQDEVFVRNQHIQTLKSENQFLANELLRTVAMLTRFKRSRTEALPEPVVVPTLSPSTTEVFTSDEEAQNTPPRQTTEVPPTAPARASARSRATLTVRPSRARRVLLPVNTQ